MGAPVCVYIFIAHHADLVHGKGLHTEAKDHAKGIGVNKCPHPGLEVPGGRGGYGCGRVCGVGWQEL
mgnify:CR=1 FL=1